MLLFYLNIGYSQVTNKIIIKNKSNSLSETAQFWGEIESKKRAAEKLALAKTYKTREARFSKYEKLTIESYKKNDYAKCIENYSLTKNLGFKSAHLEYIVGMSYYDFYIKTSKKKYKKTAKKHFKTSKKYGNIKADIFLDRYF